MTGLAWAAGLLCAATAYGQPATRRAAHSGNPRAVAEAKPAVPAAGPVFDATGLGSSLVLDRGWRVGISADPAVADPTFDDSGWAVRNASDSIAEVPDNAPEAPAAGPVIPGVRTPGVRNGGRQRRYAWFRMHIRLAAHHGPLSLLIQLPVTHSSALDLNTTGPGVRVFANGQAIAPQGPNGSDPQRYEAISRLYELNIPPEQTSLTLVLRTIYIPFGFNAYTSFFATRTLRLGTHEDLQDQLLLWRHRMVFERIARLVYSILLVVLALFLLALYFVQRGHNEYLWLALHELVQAPIGFIELAGSTARIDTMLYGALILQLMMVSAYLFFEFLISFLALPSRWYIRALRYLAPVLALVAPALLLVGRVSWIGVPLALVMLATLLWLVGWFLFISVTLVAATLRRNFEAGLLLIPLVLSLIGVLEPVVTASMSDALGRPYHSPLTFNVGPVPIHFASIADFTGVLAIIIIIFGRFVRIQRDQQRVSSELAAARTVQELMIPQEKVATPGFEVESVYSPADEVGGDFFHVQTMGDGGILVVIGDVAGKGLKAAMSVSMIMGALRRTADQSPGRILESLNRVLAGSDCFTTCQAAWFGADGELVLANAGHLPPYLNSQEIAIAGELPLGVVAEVHYPEVRLYLHPGDRVLLFSDGVVEARRPSGELFGFDRVHNLSNQSAFTIADTARTFGQVDDITVLTVRRLARPVGPGRAGLNDEAAGAAVVRASA